MKNSTRGSAVPLLIIIIVVVVALGAYFYSQNKQPAEKQDQDGAIVGNDRDTHGCIGSAGYSWCDVKQKCLRVWEEKCEVVASSTKTNPPASQTASWKTYTNSAYNFSFKYPQGLQPARYSTNLGDIVSLPIVEKGTNIAEKNIWIEGRQLKVGESCTYIVDKGLAGGLSGNAASDAITINGVSFLKETAGDAAAGSGYSYTSYSTVKNGNCISITLVIRSVNDLMMPTYSGGVAYKQYDYNTEASVMTDILSTFRF